MKNKKSTKELIKIKESEIKLLQSDIAVLKIKPSNLNEEFIVNYIETRSTAKTAEFVRSKGIKTDRGTVTEGGDISKLIKEGAVDISPKLLCMAQKIFKQNKKSVGKRYN
ncbi:MAG: hypothetical protein ACI9YH_002284 [Colwellia sp.]|jgi:hypothetical protein